MIIEPIVAIVPEKCRLIEGRVPYIHHKIFIAFVNNILA